MGETATCGDKDLSTFFYSSPFPLSFEEPVYEVGYYVAHHRAEVEGVFAQADRRADGSIVEWRGMLVIRDRGHVSAATIRKRVYVANGSKLPCELPDDAGKLIGRLQSEHGAKDWYVFSVREPERAHPRAGSTREETPPRRRDAGSEASSGEKASAASVPSARTAQTSAPASAAARGASPAAQVSPRAQSEELPESLWPL